MSVTIFTQSDWLSLTFHSTSPLKMSLFAMSTLFQATASFSSSRKSWASWLWLLQAAHESTQTCTHTHTYAQDVNMKCLDHLQLSLTVQMATAIIAQIENNRFLDNTSPIRSTLPLTRALRMTVSSSELSCSGSWTVRRCPWSSIFWIWLAHNMTHL